jgi:hypothetical protein
MEQSYLHRSFNVQSAKAAAVRWNSCQSWTAGRAADSSLGTVCLGEETLSPPGTGGTRSLKLPDKERDIKRTSPVGQEALQTVLDQQVHSRGGGRGGEKLVQLAMGSEKLGSSKG